MKYQVSLLIYDDEFLYDYRLCGQYYKWEPRSERKPKHCYYVNRRPTAKSDLEGKPIYFKDIRPTNESDRHIVSTL